jgi:oligopeptide/dipeptide ABC transporter ATP-binding protein
MSDDLTGGGAERPGTALPHATPASPSTAGRLMTRLARQPVTMLAAAFVVLVAVMAVAAPLLAPFDPTRPDYDAILQGPTAEHWLGTDHLGRDTFSRLIHGSQVALMVAFGSVAVALLIGVPLGLLLGYRGGWSDRLGSRLLDVADALPGLLLGFAVIAILGRGLSNLMLAIGLIFCGSFARITRAVTLAERERLYVDAARVAGLRTREILFRQVLPNLAGPLVVQAAVFLGSAIMVESAMSFLGLGLDSDVVSWGGMLGEATDEQARQPFLPFPPGLAIVLIVLALNLVADGVSDALTGTPRADRRRRGRRTARASAAGAAGGTALVDRPETPASAVAPSPAARTIDPVRAVLELRRVTVELATAAAGPVPLVDDVSLTVGRGEVVGLLGESGSGKSMLARSAVGLLPRGIRLAAGSVRFEGTEIAGRSERELRAVRGRGIGMVFQDPMAALSPVHTIGQQLGEPLRAHLGLSKAATRDRITDLLDKVGVENPRSRLDDYPHQFSGGMAQRVAIAMALAAEPRLLIADEATSALDVTTQSQVLDLLLDLRDEFGTAILLITHDLGVVAETCDRAAVMYAGQFVEVGDVTSLFDQPRHPYTAALLAANPSAGGEGGRLASIPGRVPLAGEWPQGCHFAGRCPFTRPGCTHRPVPLADDVRCVRAGELSLEVSAR